MTALRRALAAVVTAVALASCSTDSGEPRGLEGTPSPPEPTAVPTGAPTADQTSAPTSTAEPDPSFTQPWVPGEPSVIALPETLPVQNADDLDADEQAVVDALGHAMAAWDAMLFGAPPDMTSLDSSFSGDLLASLQNYSRDSALQQRVTVGSPTRVVLRRVTVDGDQATVSACLHTEDWVEYIDGKAGEPVEPVESYVLDAVRSGGTWTFADIESVSEPC